MKNIVLLGAPGAGKGTLAGMMVAEYNLPHISTGDILRANIKAGTELGLEAKSYIDKGELVPDSVVIGIVEARLQEADCKNGYILDGFPRTIAQAEALDKITKIEYVLNFVASYDTILHRISGRRVCSCGATYHVDWLNGSEICPKCGKELFTRNDDKPETVTSRLAVYEKQTAPLIDYYKNKGVLHDVDANIGKDFTIIEIEKVLEND